MMIMNGRNMMYDDIRCSQKWTMIWWWSVMNCYDRFWYCNDDSLMMYYGIVVSYGIMWYYVVLCGTILYGIVWYCMVLSVMKYHGIWWWLTAMIKSYNKYDDLGFIKGWWWWRWWWWWWWRWWWWWWRWWWWWWWCYGILRCRYEDGIYWDYEYNRCLMVLQMKLWYYQ